MTNPESKPIRARHEDFAILLIDLQAQFVDQMVGNRESILARLEQLLEMANRLTIPVVATLEKPVERKGDLPERFRQLLPAGSTIIEKQSYDATGEPAVRQALKSLGKQQVAVAGSETDVCVLQTVLGLITNNAHAFLVTDCVFSSSSDTAGAVQRMNQAGAVCLTLKSLYYELIRSDEHDQWNAVFAE